MIVIGKVILEVYIKECLGLFDNSINDVFYEESLIRWIIRIKLWKIEYFYYFLIVDVSFISSKLVIY